MSAFPELASCVLFMWRESQSGPVSPQSHRLRPEPLSRLFPRWLHSMCCIMWFNLIPFPGRNNRPGLTCSQGTNMHIFNEAQCFFRAKSHLRKLTSLLWKSPAARSLSPLTSVWPFDSSHVLQQPRKAFRVSRSWTCAPYFLWKDLGLLIK